MASLGIDIGGSSIKVAVLEADGSARTARSPRYARPGADEVAGALREAIAAMDPPVAAISAVGLCVPGVVDAASGAIQTSVNMPGLIGVPLRDLVAAGLGSAPARLETTSDAQAAAQDWWTTTRPAGRLLALSLGTGVGACVLDEGAPLRVTGMSSGHLGQIDVSLDEEAPVGADGGAGSLEAYIGLPALMARKSAEAEAIIDRLTIGDPALRALVRAIRIAHAIDRPNHVALLGGVGVRLAHRASALREAVDDRLTGLARSGWTLSCGKSDFHAALGAARLAAGEDGGGRSA
jgi:predicted NBD/HSP70 family sugar kinase